MTPKTSTWGGLTYRYSGFRHLSDHSAGLGLTKVRHPAQVPSQAEGAAPESLSFLLLRASVTWATSFMPSLSTCFLKMLATGSRPLGTRENSRYIRARSAFCNADWQVNWHAASVSDALQMSRQTVHQWCHDTTPVVISITGNCTGLHHTASEARTEGSGLLCCLSWVGSASRCEITGNKGAL